MPRMFPLGTVNVSVHAEYVTDSPALTDANSWIVMLRQIEVLRSLDRSLRDEAPHQQKAAETAGMWW